MAVKSNKNTNLVKDTLKNLKLHESTISMILGALVIIVVGVLVINYFRNIPANNGKISESSSTESITKVPGSTHIVVKGETLWSISEDYYGSGYNWVDIVKENNLANPNSIEEGTSLKIPQLEAKAPTVKDEVKTESKTDSISVDSYTVQKGDSIWSIAVKTYGDGYKWVEIARKNNLSNPNLIHPGNTLIIPR